MIVGIWRATYIHHVVRVVIPCADQRSGSCRICQKVQTVCRYLCQVCHKSCVFRRDGIGELGIFGATYTVLCPILELVTFRRCTADEDACAYGKRTSLGYCRTFCRINTYAYLVCGSGVGRQDGVEIVLLLRSHR